MCGIAGYMLSPGGSLPQETADKLAAAMGHRGPDGGGIVQDRHLTLVHTRLAIIDLETGDQPLKDNKGNVLVGNGEIYNNPELRAKMTDVPFQTQSDCEPPLYLYQEFRADYPEYLRGMYALALYDSKREHLLLSRDPFGIKPLYYCSGPWGIAFASEAQALIAAGIVKAQQDPLRRDELLQLQFTTGDETPFAGIKRVLPGETLVISQGKIIDRRRVPALPDSRHKPIREADALAQLDRVMTDSVKVHQRSDVPYGMFLSGGIDSAILLAKMAQLNDQPVRAYTAGFSGTAVHDERDLARHLAQKLGADHVEVDVSRDEAFKLLPEIARVIDDPTADYAVIPSYILAREAAKDVKVVLCGEGGDELFGGYGRYRSAMRPWWLMGRAMRTKGRFDGLDCLIAPSHHWRDGVRAAEVMAGQKDWGRLQQAQAVDMDAWLPNDLLVKLDRCLMAHSLEGRTPFLDPEVANFAFTLPNDLKIQNRLGKHLLRRYLNNMLPEAAPFSKKRGFTVPVGEWIAAEGKRLGPLVAAQAGVAEIAHPEVVETLFTKAGGREGQAAWTLLFYALWHQAHIMGTATDGDVFEVLAG